MLPEIEKGGDIEIKMQDVEDAMNVLCAYAIRLEEHLKDEPCFSDKVKDANRINSIWKMHNEWDEDLSSGWAFLVFGFTDKDIGEYRKKISKQRDKDVE